MHHFLYDIWQYLRPTRAAIAIFILSRINLKQARTVYFQRQYIFRIYVIIFFFLITKKTKDAAKLQNETEIIEYACYLNFQMDLRRSLKNTISQA